MREVTDKFEHLEVAIKASIIVVEDSTPEQKQSKVKLAYKYDEVLLLTAIESLYSVIEEKESAIDTIKAAETELIDRLQCYRVTQRELAVNAIENIDEMIESMQRMMEKCTKARVDAGRAIEVRRSVRTKQESGMKRGPNDSLLRMERMKMPTFSGNIRDFPRFKDDFEKQVMPTLQSDQSVAYVLRTCLSGEALNIVRNVDNSLSEMWKRLVDRFGRTTKLADVIMYDIKQLRVTSDGDDR